MMHNNKDDFYIGWQAFAPMGILKHMRRSILGIVCLAFCISVTIALLQRKFSTAVFEYGQLTEVKGIYQHFPVPSIIVETTKDAFGKTTYLTIPLVGYGKFGAAGLIRELESINKTSLEHKQITLKGFLIYSEGKTLLQIDGNDNPLLQIGETSGASTAPLEELGDVHLIGEVIDPKCYFGVMKPGQGKPHRDCAIRCLEGGMPAVFFVGNDKGQSNYYLLLDKGGNVLNHQLKNFVGDPVSLSARAVRHGDWDLLYLNSMEDIQRTGGLSWFKERDRTISCSPN